MIRVLKARIAPLFSTATRINAVTSYLSLGLSMVFGVLAVRLAYSYLDQEQYGIWSLFAKALGVLVLLDLGVSAGAGRMLAEPVRTRDAEQLDLWWTVVVVVLVCQAALMLICGMAAETLILSHTKIPPALAASSSLLWKVMVICNSLKMTFQAYPGILFCQNRFYHMNLSIILGAVLNMLIFFVMLKMGFGLNAYTAAVAVQILAMVIYWWVAVKVSRIRLRLRFALFEWSHVRRLFGYSGSLFAFSTASTLTLVFQNFMVERYLGYAAVGAFNVATNAFVVLSQLLLRTSEAKVPRWWQLYDSGERSGIVADRTRLMSWFVPLLIFTGAGLLLYNRSFVSLLTGPGMNLGRPFDVLLGVTLVVTLYLKSNHFIFPLVQRTWPWALVAVADAVLQVIFGAILIRYWGTFGLLMGALFSTLVTSLPFSLFASPPLLQSSFRDFYRGALSDVLLGAVILTAFAIVAVRSGDSNGWFPMPLEWIATPGIVALGCWTLFRFFRSIKGGQPSAPQA